MKWSANFLNIENQKDIIRKLLDLINKFGKVVGYKINAQKCLAFLHTNNKSSGREIKEIITFSITTTKKYICWNKPTWGSKRPVLRKL